MAAFMPAIQVRICPSDCTDCISTGFAPAGLLTLIVAVLFWSA